MEDFELIRAFQIKISEIYEKEELCPLRGINDDLTINGREILTWWNDVLKCNADKYNLHASYFDLQNDLLICSDEIMYFTAHLFLYRPIMNNPLQDGYLFYGNMSYPNRQNLAGKRYSMYADVTSQKTYNYWDRIGDLIASFFPEKFSNGLVYFATAIERVPDQFHTIDSYLWLKEFKQGEYLKMNALRKKIVHHTTTDTGYREDHLKIKNKDEMFDLQSNREQLPDYYKRQLKLSIQGFEQTLLLLEAFNSVIFTNC